MESVALVLCMTNSITMSTIWRILFSVLGIVFRRAILAIVIVITGLIGSNVECKNRVIRRVTIANFSLSFFLNYQRKKCDLLKELDP